MVDFSGNGMSRSIGISSRGAVRVASFFCAVFHVGSLSLTHRSGMNGREPIYCRPLMASKTCGASTEKYLFHLGAVYTVVRETLR